jgi:signal transduction histidine kinase
VELEYQRSARFLGAYYFEHGNWQGVQDTVDRMAEVSGSHVILADGEGNIVADSSHNLVGQPANPRWASSSAPVFIPDPNRARPPGNEPRLGDALAPKAPSEPLLEGSEPPLPSQRVGTVYLNVETYQGIDETFLASINRSLLVAAVAAGLLALLLTVVLSRRVIGPIENLTAAVQRIEAGQLHQKVEVNSTDEVGKLAKAFNSMTGALERNEQLRHHMVSDVAHELRTPLTNLRGYLEGIRDGVILPNRQTVEILYEEADTLGRLVDDLQELALAEARQLHLDFQPVPVGQMVERAVAGMDPRFAAQGATLETNIPPNLPPVWVDELRVQQVLRNLLANALAHSRADDRVTISAQLDGDWVEVAVQDIGEGISAEDLPYIFERFYRADHSRARATGGAGLGLTIAKSLVEAHGGAIWVESQPCEGARFTFTLPAKPPLLRL